MFEAVELGQKVSKTDFNAAVPELRTKLLKLQYEIKDKGVPVIIIVSGVEGAGKSEVVNRINEWLDARWIRDHAFWYETEEERLHPRYWRFWRALPPRGTSSVMFGSWYTRPIIDHVMGKIGKSEFDREMKYIEKLEEMLVHDDALIIKLWFHLPRDVSLERVKKKSNIISPLQKKFSKKYDQFATVSERAIQDTDTAHSPWHIIEATDRRYRDLATGQILLERMEKKLQDLNKKVSVKQKTTSKPKKIKTVLDEVNLEKTITDKKYRQSLEKHQENIRKLAWAAHNEKRSVVAVFEGWDAAGKGGTIRRITSAIDARLYNVISVAAPTDEEKAHHYFWRFWRHLPLDGYISIYDRSWYGRVLVERVEGFAEPEEWLRSYQEINDFEEQLTSHGIILIKFWLHLSKDEQLRRFKEREVTPWKKHKITDEDWRNREKWNAYELAVNEMVGRTSTIHSPWKLIPANDKKVARVTVLKEICDQIKSHL